MEQLTAYVLGRLRFVSLSSGTSNVAAFILTGPRRDWLNNNNRQVEQHYPKLLTETLLTYSRTHPPKHSLTHALTLTFSRLRSHTQSPTDALP